MATPFVVKDLGSDWLKEGKARQWWEGGKGRVRERRG